jgi:ubiquinone/menaquinone biosynthesis C-methylase UbiE
VKFKEYLQTQMQTSAWTRQNVGSIALVADMVNEFATFASPAMKVLEIGCGDGFSLDVMKSKGFNSVIGADINLNKLKFARQNGHRATLLDVHQLGVASNSVDAVYCTHTLEHSYNGYRALQEICRVLKPGGIVFLIVPDHTQRYGDTYTEPEKVLDLDERSIDLFENIVLERTGARSEIARNHFPFTMKLFIATMLHANLEIQWAARIERDGPELWGVAVKPVPNVDFTAPLITRSYMPTQPKKRKSLLRRILRRAKSVLNISSL